MISQRLIECKRLLKSTGSIYLHCDPTSSHYIKLVMDSIFGIKNYRNEIVWSYRKMTNRAKLYQKSNDIIFFYSMSDDYTFNKQYEPFSESSRKTHESKAEIWV